MGINASYNFISFLKAYLAPGPANGVFLSAASDLAAALPCAHSALSNDRVARGLTGARNLDRSRPYVQENQVSQPQDGAGERVTWKKRRIHLLNIE
jgi:hypothetical protein